MEANEKSLKNLVVCFSLLVSQSFQSKVRGHWSVTVVKISAFPETIWVSLTTSRDFFDIEKVLLELMIKYIHLYICMTCVFRTLYALSDLILFCTLKSL